MKVKEKKSQVKFGSNVKWMKKKYQYIKICEMKLKHGLEGNL